MPERSSVAQVQQIGVEVTPGTAVAATRRLGAMSIVPTINPETDPYRPQGAKFPTVMTMNREWAEVAMDGKPTYEEVVYPLAMALTAPTVSQIMDGGTPTGVYEWDFSPSTTAADSPKTVTLENGQSGVQAEKFAHVMLASFGIEFSRAEVSMSGSGFAQAAVAGITPTAALAFPATLTPVQPGHFSVYMADTQAALSSGGASDATKKLTRVVSGNANVEDRFTPAWFVNQAIQSFTTFVEGADGTGGTSALTLEADAAAMALLPTLRTGAKKFIRLEAIGPVVYNAGAQPNLAMRLRWDQCVTIGDVDTMSDEDGIYAIPFTFQPTHDTTWGKAHQVVVRNTVTAL